MGSYFSKSSDTSSPNSVDSYLEYNEVKQRLNVGDLIEIQRNSYKHWVICDTIEQNGIVWCFHVSGLPTHECNDSKDVVSNGITIIKYEPLLDILKDNNSSNASLCRVNNQQNMAQKMMNTSNSGLPDITQVLKMLHKLKDSVVEYDVKSMNCEHYCTLWKYGMGWSSQVNTYHDIITGTLKTVSSLIGTAGTVFMSTGFWIFGSICIIISSITAIAAKIVENINFSLNLKMDGLVRLPIAS